ncbi:hypothetical protein LX15_001485 [Streptoalloteichus tenebrarius]|uniref:Uncharacterized protein n=1 Tax=Streptoalloteichus tenebrarius (strain ATCC 17920 / DSM 40477 / JCM 4838 / CBS 697.72 / NBRC 16177 / NCIMB 11028 / NRRL B-12390 / A12253. 1 / ISP 5477) TaxID=1933 RepID=A0ABT1HQK0_STRSD|nr:hypothetical protein [Streptoalloteichus tenebrarius]
MGAHAAEVDRDLPVEFADHPSDHPHPHHRSGQGRGGRPPPEPVVDTVLHGPYRAGGSRHATPVFALNSNPLITRMAPPPGGRPFLPEAGNTRSITHPCPPANVRAYDTRGSRSTTPTLRTTHRVCPRRSGRDGDENGAAHIMTNWFAPVACRWARTTPEPTQTSQSRSLISSAITRNRATAAVQGFGAEQHPVDHADASQHPPDHPPLIAGQLMPTHDTPESRSASPTVRTGRRTWQGLFSRRRVCRTGSPAPGEGAPCRRWRVAARSAPTGALITRTGRAGSRRRAAGR